MISGSIKNKIINRTSIVIIIALLISNSFACYYFSMLLMKISIDDDRSKLYQNSQHMEYIIEDIRNLSRTIIVDPQIQSFFESQPIENDSEYIFILNETIEKLESLTNLRKYVRSSVIVTNHGEVYWSSYPYSDYFKKN